jgi:hypothetical protein
MTLRLVALAAGTALCLTAARAADDDAAARLAAAQQMMTILHADQIEDVRIGLIVDRAKAHYREERAGTPPGAIDHYGDVLREELARDKAKLLALRTQYYAEHFTAAELTAWGKLLDSEIGRKMTDSEPMIMRDLYGVDALWITNAMERTARRLAAETDGS